jgi:hypothetical protein
MGHRYEANSGCALSSMCYSRIQTKVGWEVDDVIDAQVTALPTKLFPRQLSPNRQLLPLNHFVGANCAGLVKEPEFSAYS